MWEEEKNKNNLEYKYNVRPLIKAQCQSIKFTTSMDIQKRAISFMMLNVHGGEMAYYLY